MLVVVPRNLGPRDSFTFSHVTPWDRAAGLLFYSEGVFLLKLRSSYKAKLSIMRCLRNEDDLGSHIVLTSLDPVLSFLRAVLQRRDSPPLALCFLEQFHSQLKMQFPGRRLCVSSRPCHAQLPPALQMCGASLLMGNWCVLEPVPVSFGQIAFKPKSEYYESSIFRPAASSGELTLTNGF